MSREIYPALSGAMASWRQLDVIANNLANTSTAGFKERRLSFEAVGRSDGAEWSDSFVRTDMPRPTMSDGAVMVDKIDTHIALEGPGFLVAERNGEEVLVRAGSLQVDDQRRLTTPDGSPILGQSGFIELPEDQRMVISADGQVTTGAGEVLDRLLLLEADDVEPLGNSMYRAVGDTRPAEGLTVIQGALEGSTTNPMRSMTDLIQAGRYFDIYQKAMQTADELEGRTNDMARK